MTSRAPKSVTSKQRLSRVEFEQLVTRLRAKPVRARKTGFVAARQAVVEERVETHWNGTETMNTAQPGDWVVTNLSPDRVPLRDSAANFNTYVVSVVRFSELYEPCGTAIDLGPVFRSKAVVQALRLPGGIDIVAPWGERQQIADGYLILNGDEVYGNQTETFEATYEVMSD
jgi:hypothetical protein